MLFPFFLILEKTNTYISFVMLSLPRHVEGSDWKYHSLGGFYIADDIKVWYQKNMRVFWKVSTDQGCCEIFISTQFLRLKNEGISQYHIQELELFSYIDSIFLSLIWIIFASQWFSKHFVSHKPFYRKPLASGDEYAYTWLSKWWKLKLGGVV